MPSKKQYNLVNDDAYDSRIPLHSEEAFNHGITFQVKYIGSLDVVRPSSRVEIVAAMRRVRYEFKAKAIKKRKVIVEISVDGVKINVRKKKKKNDRFFDEKILLMHHPVYRIFYVSHDSQDLKIFSYIARDGTSNVFKCNVFKSKKKSQALRIVRTVGQAFEVCHKLSISHNSHNEEEKQEDLESERSQETSNDTAKKLKPASDRVSEPNSCDTQTEEIPETPAVMPVSPSSAQAQRPAKADQHQLNANSLEISNHVANGGRDFYAPVVTENVNMDALSTVNGPISTHHELHLVKHQLEQQKQHTQVAASQVRLLRDQLQAESVARVESQSRTHQLLQHNNDLLEHIQNLVKQLQDFEGKFSQIKDQERSENSNKDLVSNSSQIQILCDTVAPSSTAILLPPSLHDIDHTHHYDHSLGVIDNRNAVNMLNVASAYDQGLIAGNRIPKPLDTMSVSSLSSCAFSRSPSFRMSASPNVINSEESHQTIPNIHPLSNQNNLRSNTIPVNSTSPLFNNFDPQRYANTDLAKTHSPTSHEHFVYAPKQNYLQPQGVLPTVTVPSASVKQKVTRHCSSDDAILLHPNDHDFSNKNMNLTPSRTLPSVSSSLLENVTADIGHSYGRQYSLNLQQQNQNLVSNFADLNMNDTSDTSRNRSLFESLKSTDQPTLRMNHSNGDEELVRTSSLRKSYIRK